MSDDRERTLRALQTLRASSEAKAQGALAAALRAEARAVERLERARQALREHRATDGRHGATPTLAFALQQAERHRAGRTLREQALRVAARLAEAEAGHARRLVAEARREVSRSHAERRAVEQRLTQADDGT